MQRSFCSALTTFLLGLAAFWNLERDWIESKVLLTKPEMLKLEFEFCRAQGPMDGAELVRFLNRYQSIINQNAEYWQSVLEQATQRSTRGN